MQTMPKLIEPIGGPLLVELTCIDPAKVSQFWHLAEPYIEAATQVGDWTTEEIHDRLLSGHALLWLPIEGRCVLGAVVTGIGETKIKTCTIIACGGDDFPRWKHLISVIEEFAKSDGCKVVRISGRIGWKRMFPDYNEPFVTIEKKLE